jgi:thioredoxin reductase (NADPH)
MPSGSSYSFIFALDARACLTVLYGLPRRGWHVERLPLPLETSMPGVFAAGDVRHGAVKRVASTVGEGSIAIQTTHEYLDLTQHQTTAVTA